MSQQEREALGERLKGSSQELGQIKVFNKELNKSIKDLQGALQQMKNEQERLQREKEDSLQQIKDL